jgi:hypothetical protein
MTGLFFFVLVDKLELDNELAELSDRISRSSSRAFSSLCL